jgi:SAM-dependent methyltransferase
VHEPSADPGARQEGGNRVDEKDRRHGEAPFLDALIMPTLTKEQPWRTSRIRKKLDLGVRQNVAVAIHPSAQGFQTAAGDYERGRPDYPEEAGRWLAERLDLRPGRTVLDIAAGTGKLTRLLAVSGPTVIAVEPVAGMRERLAAALPDAAVLDGVAEAIPLDDASVDAATVGQAFHWFDGDRALKEIHRVARAGSRLAVVYNRRRLDDPLQAAMDAILRPLRGDAPAHDSGQWRAAFTHSPLWAPLDELELAHVQLLDREGVVARAASTSFIGELPADRRAAVLDQVRSLVTRRAEPIELPYVSELFAWQRLP